MISRLGRFGFCQIGAATRWSLAAFIFWSGAVLVSCDRQPKSNVAAKAADEPAERLITTEALEKSLAAVDEYIQRDELAKAQAVAKALIKRAPAEARAREAYGQVLMHMAIELQQQQGAAPDSAAGSLRQQAYGQYRLAVELDPKSAGLQHSAGVMANTAGLSEQAIAHFRKAGELDGANPQHPLFEAQVLMQLQRWDEAQAAIGRAIALDGDEPLALASLALLLFERGKVDEALEIITQARRSNPDDLGLRVQEAKLHRRRGQPRESLELLIGLNAQDRAAEAVAFEIAASYQLLGDHAKAAQAWEHSYRSNSASPRAWFAIVHAGTCWHAAGDVDRAQRCLEAAQHIAPTEPKVKELAASLRR